MTSNTKEYQREYQKEYRKTHPQKQYKKVKTQVKKEVKILHPPRAPKMVEKSILRSKTRDLVEKPSKNIDSKTIDFSYLTNNHSFQMAILEFMKKFAPGLENIKVRGNKEVMKQSFNENANNYRNVMKELKQVLEMKKK